jgi:hypothetical protein
MRRLNHKMDPPYNYVYSELLADTENYIVDELVGPIWWTTWRPLE